MRGVQRIVRYNWPFYAAGAAALGAAAFAAPRIGTGWPLGALVAAAGTALFWMLASVAASWLVYDRSPLMRWRWIGDVISAPPRSWINVHAGLDESTSALRELFGQRGSRSAGDGLGGGRVFDIFDPAVMTEPSIARARETGDAAAESERVDFRRLPAASGSADAVLLLLSAHELRSPDDRIALFREVHRVLTPEGTAIVAEHLRDAANLAAFGPGALHFHSRRSWRSCFAAAQLTVAREFPITPFVRVFVLRARRGQAPSLRGQSPSPARLGQLTTAQDASMGGRC